MILQIILPDPSDPLQESARFLGQLIFERDRILRERARQLAQQRAGQEVESPAEREAFQRTTGAVPEEGEVFGGPAAEFNRKLTLAMNTFISDPSLAPLFGFTAATQAVGGELTSPEAEVAGVRAEEAKAALDQGESESALQFFNGLPDAEKGRVSFFVLNKVVPQQVEALEADAELSTAVVRTGLNVLNDPENRLARIVERVTGLEVGDIVGATALGLDSLLSQALRLRFDQDDDWEETVNNVVETVSEQLQGQFSPAQIKRVFAMKDRGMTRSQIPEGLRPVWDAMESGGVAVVMKQLGEATAARPEQMFVGRLLELGRQIDLNSEPGRRLSNLFGDLMKFSMLQTTPDWPELQRGLRSDDPEVREQARRNIQVRLDRLDRLLPTLESTAKFGILPFGPTETTVGRADLPGATGVTPPDTGPDQPGRTEQLSPMESLDPADAEALRREAEELMRALGISGGGGSGGLR